MRSVVGVVGVVVAGVTMWFPSFIVSVVFMIVLCNMVWNLSFWASVGLTVLFFNVWHWGGFAISGSLMGIVNEMDK